MQCPWLSALLCFVSQIVVIPSVPYLSFSRGILFTGVSETQCLSNLHRDDKRQDAQGFGLSAAPGAKGGVFSEAARPLQVTQLGNREGDWEE